VYLPVEIGAGIAAAGALTALTVNYQERIL
jgi:hypothetical protein